VRLVDDADRGQQETGAQGKALGEAVVQIGLLQGQFATRFAALELGIFDFQLGPERQAIVEGVGEIQDESPEVDLSRAIGTGAVRVMDLAITADGRPFLGSEECREAYDDEDQASWHHVALSAGGGEVGWRRTANRYSRRYLSELNPSSKPPRG